MIHRLTIKTYVTNLNASYVYIPFVVIGTLVALLGPSGGDLLYRIALVNAAFWGLLTGTTLAEIKVKPLSFCMPGQEQSMGPAIIVCALVVSLSYSALLFVRPMTSVDVHVVQQFLTVFLWSLSSFLLIVNSAVHMRDSVLSLLGLSIVFVLLIATRQHSGIDAGWRFVTTFLAESPVLATGAAVVAVAATHRGLRSREVSRELCGAAFLPLKAFDNPFKMQDFKSRMRSAAFRPSSRTSSQGLPIGRLLVKLSERLAGSSWDFLLHESRLSGNTGEFVGKVIYVGALAALMVFVLWRDAMAGLPGLYILVAMVFLFFAPGFNARVSPMLPISRGQYFKALLAKAGLIYLSALALIVLFRWLVAVLEPVFSPLTGTVLAELAQMPATAVFLLALNVPLLSWGFTTFRSTAGYLIFFLIYVLVSTVSMAGMESTLDTLSISRVLLATAACWLPFLVVAWRRCYRHDLLRQ